MTWAQTLSIIIALVGAIVYQTHYADKRIAALRAEMNRGFESVNQRFEAVNQRFEDLLRYIDQRFKSLEEKLDQRFKRLEDRLDHIESAQRITRS